MLRLYNVCEHCSNSDVCYTTKTFSITHVSRFLPGMSMKVMEVKPARTRHDLSPVTNFRPRS